MIEQLEDDIELLKLMMNDSKGSKKEYQPTNFWSNYEKKNLPELMKYGLKDFRRKHNSIFGTFGATDISTFSNIFDNPNKSFIQKAKSNYLKLYIKLKNSKYAEKEINSSIKNNSGINLESYNIAKEFGVKNNAVDLEKISVSMIGNPEDYFLRKNNNYTISFLYYYIQYAYCCKFIDFSTIKNIAELGSGAGKQIEVLKKVFPHLTFFVFDIPPQLYIAEKYLSKLFPQKVVSYRETRTMKEIPLDTEGMIYILGNWKIGELENLEYDVFWNSASFQEMEPKIVENYLSFVNKQTKKYCFLHEMMKGQTKAKGVGEFGVIEKTTLEHYKTGLKDFKMIDSQNALHLPKIISKKKDYSFSIWRKNRF